MKNSAVMSKEEKTKMIFFLLMILIISFFMFSHPAFAAADMKSIVQQIVDKVICPIFTAIGVLLSLSSVGSLVLAFKTNDPEAQSRAAGTLVAGIALIGIRVMINGLHLTDYIG